MGATTGAKPFSPQDDSWDPPDQGPRHGTKTDRDGMAREARARDRRARAAYYAGRRGEAPSPDLSDEERLAHQTGLEEAAQPTAAPPSRGGRRGAGRRPKTQRSPWLGPSRPVVKPKGPGTSSRPLVAPAQGVTQKVTGSGSGLFVGMVLYCLGINYMRYGSAGVTGWFKAKFFNEPMGSSSGSGASSFPSPKGDAGPSGEPGHNSGGGDGSLWPGGPKVSAS